MSSRLLSLVLLLVATVGRAQEAYAVVPLNELKITQSMHDGAMASVLCVLLRTPRRRIGVLHLDRSFWQQSFNEDDMLLADAQATPGDNLCRWRSPFLPQAAGVGTPRASLAGTQLTATAALYPTCHLL